MKSALGSQSPRGGIVLLQVSFLILVIMGLLAVVVDMGIARATQNLMQSSADIAAMEALRYRDANLDPVLGDLERRRAAQRLAAYVFDEDLDLSTGPGAYRLGAGPQFTTGVGGVDDPAGGLLESRGPFLPALELNADENESFGDLVSGAYTATDPGAAGNPNWHAENGLYERLDFDPDAPDDNAFLARIRRTNDRLGLDRRPGVSSAGATLPFLFGLGSGVLTTDDGAVYDPRRDGITVRATAIADARPVVRAGVMSEFVNLGIARLGSDFDDPAVARVLSFQDDALWQAVPASGWPPSTLATGVRVQVDATTGSIQGDVLGFAQPAVGILRVGDGVDPSVARPVQLELPVLEVLRYAALYAGGRITGFAAVVVRPDPPDGLEVIKLGSLIAPENASALPDSLTDITALSASASLLAPVLAR